MFNIDILRQLRQKLLTQCLKCLFRDRTHHVGRQHDNAFTSLKLLIFHTGNHRFGYLEDTDEFASHSLIL